MNEPKEHTIIDQPYLYDIQDFHYHHDKYDDTQSYIDMVLVKDDTIKRRLRFTEPTDLKIEAGFPYPTRGMCIYDISDHQMERINIHVSDFECSTGEVTFYAYDIIDLDQNNEIKSKV